MVPHRHHALCELKTLEIIYMQGKLYTEILLPIERTAWACCGEIQLPNINKVWDFFDSVNKVRNKGCISEQVIYQTLDYIYKGQL